MFVFKRLIPGHYAGDCTSMEQLDLQYFRAEALEIHIGEGGASLDKPSEYHAVFKHQFVGT